MRTDGPISIDYTDEGQGTPVVLIHSSVSSNRQWRALTDALIDRYRVRAVNLFGYGKTSPWSGPAAQTLSAQAGLVTTVCEDLAGPIHLVGHSFGGAVALKAAAVLGSRVGKLILLEPNPFPLLEQAGRREACAEIAALASDVRRDARSGHWTAAAERFADYWLGDGAWAGMSEGRRVAFARSMPPLLHELDAVLSDETTVADWCALPARTLLVSDTGTRRTIRELVDVFEAACPHWTFVRISGAGHMAPLTHPELVNPVVREFLDLA
jgi:pimeloyl-ACP methyl ester carboxylesterase